MSFLLVLFLWSNSDSQTHILIRGKLKLLHRPVQEQIGSELARTIQAQLTDLLFEERNVSS